MYRGVVVHVCTPTANLEKKIPKDLKSKMEIIRRETRSKIEEITEAILYLNTVKFPFNT